MEDKIQQMLKNFEGCWYDLVGSTESFMIDKDKHDYFKQIIEQDNETKNKNMITKKDIQQAVKNIDNSKADSAIERAKELIDDIETEIIVDKNVKLFNQLRAKELQRFHKPDGVSNNLFMWTMFAMAVIGLMAAAWLGW